MTDPQVSRRNALILAGAGVTGLALAGCDSTGQPNNPAKITGPYTPYGLDPNGKPPAGFPTFDPKYITLVRISANKAWSLSVNHASFPVGDANNRAKREALAASIFKAIAPDQQSHKRFNSLNPTTFKQHKRTTGGFKNQHDVVSFAEFGANQQTEIYVWFDHYDDSNQTSKKDDVQVDPNYLVSFSQLTSAKLRANENDAFFAREANLANLAGPFIAIENYFTSKSNSGQYVIDPPQTSGTAKSYSLNLAFSVPDNDGAQTGALKRIPLLIDPDTGNGMGHEP